MSYIPTDERIVTSSGLMTPVFRSLVQAMAPTTRGTIVIRLLDGHAEGSFTAAPTLGTWAQGDRVWNSAATVGQPIGWICTVSGSPGTWVAMANL